MDEQNQIQQGDQSQGIQQQLVEAFGIADLPEDKQQEILSRAGELILKRLFLKVANTLSEEEKDQFDEILGKNPKQEEISAFLQEKIPNLNEVMQAEIKEFKSEFQINQ